MTKIFFILLITFLVSCDDSIDSYNKFLICKSDGKSWVLIKEIKNGEVLNVDGPHGKLDYTFFCDGTFGSSSRHRDHWALSPNSDSIYLNFRTSINGAKHQSKIELITTDSLIIKTVIDKNTVTSYLVSQKEYLP